MSQIHYTKWNTDIFKCFIEEKKEIICIIKCAQKNILKTPTYLNANERTNKITTYIVQKNQHTGIKTHKHARTGPKNTK